MHARLMVLFVSCRARGHSNVAAYWRGFGGDGAWRYRRPGDLSNVFTLVNQPAQSQQRKSPAARQGSDGPLTTGPSAHLPMLTIL